MKLLKYIIIVLLTIIPILSYSQNELNWDRKDVLSLRLIPTLSDEDKLIQIISMLTNPESEFKYRESILRQEFLIKQNENGYDLYLLNEKNKGLVENNIKDVIKIKRNVVLKTNLDYNNKENELYIVNPEKYGLSYFNNLMFVNGKSLLSFIYRDKLFIDQDILSGIGINGPTQIFNRERARAFLKDRQGNVASLFGDPFDGTIVPDNNGTDAKVFITDRGWNKIIYSNKSYNPIIGNQLFAAHGQYGSGIGQYQHPCGITYGNITNEGFRRIFIADYSNKRIQQEGYKLSSNTHIWTSTQKPLLKENLSYPTDLVFHNGTYINNTDDDLLWFTENGNNNSIRCITANSGTLAGADVFSFNKYSFNGTVYYDIIPINIDIHSDYINNHAYRTILGFVDARNNSVVLIHLNNEGVLPNDLIPEAFAVIPFPENERVSSLKFITALTGTTDMLGLIVSSNDLNRNGHLHRFKVWFSPSGGSWITPVGVSYIASSDKGFIGGNYSLPLKDIGNIETQNNFNEIFILEDWNNNYGMRRFKSGADIISHQWDPDYCYNYGINVTINTANPVRVIPETMVFKNAWNEYRLVPATINGISTNGNPFYLQTGVNYINVKLQIPNSEALTPVDNKVLIRLYCLPIDEINYTSPNRTLLEFNKYPGNCTPPVGGCPFVFVYDGLNMAQDNNILHRSNFADLKGTDITDKYKLNVFPKFNELDSTCNLQLKELDNDYSYIDKFQLKAVDHPQGTILGITENNDLVLYFPEDIVNPSLAYQNEINVTSNLQYDSTRKPISGDSSDVINSISDLGKIKIKYEFKKTKYLITTALSKLLLLRNDKKEKDIIFDNIVQDSIAVILDGYRVIENGNVNKEYAGVINAYNNDAAYSSGPKLFARRESNSIIIVPVSKDIIIDSINAVWTRNYTTSFLCTAPIYYEGFIEKSMELISADNPIQGDIKSLLLDKDENYANLDNQGEINLNFKKPLDETPVGWMRDYVIIVDGRYERMEGKKLTNKATNNSSIPKEFKLYQNFPNPFNPISNIKYDVPKDTRVKIVIYDLVGREIKTLVNEVKEAGSYNIQFNGSNLASGVYFYRIQAGDYILTKRMVLIK